MKKRDLTIQFSIILLLASTMLLSCEGTILVEEILASNINILSVQEVKTINNSDGGTLQLRAEITPTNSINTQINWSVDDESIATVDNNGLLTAMKNGTVKAIATLADNSEIKGIIEVTISNHVSHDRNDPTKSIQETIDSAEEGDTIIIPAGTYEESNIIINKPLTFRGESKKDVIFSSPIQITGKDIKIENLSAEIRYRHEIESPGEQHLTAFVVYDEGEVLFDNVNIKRITYSSSSKAKGIISIPGAKVEVKNSLFKNLTTGIFVNVEGFPSDPDTQKVTMIADHNIFINNKVGIGGTENSNVTIINNIFVTKPGKNDESIGLGEGVIGFDAEGKEIDNDLLESTLYKTNSFKFGAIGDYRISD